MRTLTAILVSLTLFLAACGDDGAGNTGFGAGDDAGDDLPTITGSAGANTEDIEPCSLLTDEELTAVLGAAPVGEESEPAGPFTGCSWGTGDVIVSIATSDEVILAPGEEDCPSVGLGEDSYGCEDRVKFLVDGVHVTVSTINAFVEDPQLVELGRAVEAKIAG